ncbi:hypothetical protein Mal15_55140 [Stieleria maiorica]|uniref:Uncharacterized protein n=1 Tax=Stieleria maiorica TaxID=2795974 RepID=A0A5B9MQX7_9BACT|nr:hypothetical protein [Stieleria maiorica]QEG01438.1 hypothetical protein Mal15_55140 [Stieleria maiorica]
MTCVWSIRGLEIDGQVSEWGQWIGDTRVAIATLPANLGSNESAEGRYESSAVGLAEAWDGFVVLSEPIESAGVEGRHQIINTGPIIFRRHFYIVNEVALIAVASYPEHDHDESVVEHFLSRFELLRDGDPVAPLDPGDTLNSRELE